MLGLTDGRVGDGDAQFVAALFDFNAHRPARWRGFDAVINGIFQQGLQHQRWNRQIHRNCPNFPVDRKTLAEAKIFQFEVLPAEFNFIGQADQFARIAHRRTEEIRECFERRLSLLRPGANQRQHGIQRIKEKMRADAGVQGGQPRLGLGWRKGTRAQLKIAEQQGRGCRRQQHRAHCAIEI